MKKTYGNRKCDLCGKPFVRRSPAQKYCSDECYRIMWGKKNNDRKKEVRQIAKSGIPQAEKEDASKLVSNACPKDCRFRDGLGGGTYYCNYGEIACAEGLIDKPARNFDPDNATYNCGGKLYEPGKSKRKKPIALISKPKTDEEVKSYQREVSDKFVGNQFRRGNLK